jgi:hypothetical protein
MIIRQGLGQRHALGSVPFTTSPIACACDRLEATLPLISYFEPGMINLNCFIINDAVGLPTDILVRYSAWGMFLSCVRGGDRGWMLKILTHTTY